MTAQSHKTLLIQPLPGIGDMTWFLPHIRALAKRSHNKKISILTKPSSQIASLLGHESILEEVLWLNSKRSVFELAKTIREKKFDEAWILHHSPRYALACWLAGIPTRIGYGFGWQRYLLTNNLHLPSHMLKKHNIEKANRFLDVHQIPVEKSDAFLTTSKKAQTAIGKRFSALPKPWCCFGIGCTEPVRAWPQQAFSELAAKIVQGSNHTVFLLGSKMETELAQEISRLAGGKDKRIVAVTDLSLDQSCALIQASAFFVGNDSGLLNLSACLNRPTIGLFGNGEVLDYRDNILPVTPDDKAPKSMSGITIEDVMHRLRQERLLT